MSEARTTRARRVTFGALASAVAAGALCGSILVASTSAFAESAVGLGTAESFAVLAGSGITNTGATTITGDVGSFETTTQTGFGSVTLNGANHFGDAVTQGAKTDLVTAYDEAAGRSPFTVVPVELGGSTLLAGVYRSPTFGLTGTLTLDAQGDPNAEFIFQAGTTLTTATDSEVLLINGADPCRVVWQIGSSATFGTRTEFVGDVLALTSITANTSATFEGRLLARNGAVTLQSNTITNASCVTPAAVTTTTAGGGAATTTSTVATTTSTTSVATTVPPVGSGPASPTGAIGPGGAGPTATPAATVTPIVPAVAPASGTAAGTPAGITGRVPTAATPGPDNSTPALATTGAPLAVLVAIALGLVSSGSVALRSARRR